MRVLSLFYFTLLLSEYCNLVSHITHYYFFTFIIVPRLLQLNYPLANFSSLHKG